MKKLKIIMILMLTFFAGVVLAKAGLVHGVVTSADNGQPIAGVNVVLKGTLTATLTDIDGKYSINAITGQILQFTALGYIDQEVRIPKSYVVNVQLISDAKQELAEQEISMDMTISPGYPAKYKKSQGGLGATYGRTQSANYYAPYGNEPQNWNTEDYATIHDNIFHNPLRTPLSTFSIDVDAASYSNIRRFLNNGQQPPKDAVRIEEMVNYFNYDYKSPKGEHPFSVNTEVSQAPWSTTHKLVHIGIQGKEIATENLPASNIVFFT